MKQKCEEIIIDQYLKGVICNEYKNAALEELDENKEYGLIDLLITAEHRNHLTGQIKKLEQIYFKKKCEILKKEIEELEDELFK